MTKYKLEYIWLDGYKPVPNLRGKTQIKEFDAFPKLEQLPIWGFDGSSTRQAEGHNSDCVLKPVAVYPDTHRNNGALVMCEVMHARRQTPHPSNARATILDDPGAWFGFEQEYFFYKDGRPLGFPVARLSGAAGPILHRRRLQERRRHRPRDRRQAPRPLPRRRHQPRRHQRRSRQGPVGIPDLRQRLQDAPPTRCGSPATSDAPREKYGVDIDWHCKPLGDTDWNGSGMHCNFSTDYMREVGGKEYFEALMAAFDKNRTSTSRSMARTTTCA